MTPAADLPKLVEISAVISSRYPGNCRPASWDDRSSGIDVVRGTEGSTFKLRSSGGQSPPQPGWKIVLRNGSPEEGFAWTLYGIAGNAH